MSGQLIVYYDGKDPEQFLKSVFEFPQVLPVVSKRSDVLKKLSDEKNRSVLFMGAEEAKMFFSPDFVFYYGGSSGKSIEDVAVKLKQDFVVMFFFGKKIGNPIALKRNVNEETAAPIVIYEILKVLRGF